MLYESKFFDIMDFLLKLAAAEVFQSFPSAVYNVATKSYNTVVTLMALLVRIVIVSKFFHLQQYGSSLSYYLKKVLGNVPVLNKGL